MTVPDEETIDDTVLSLREEVTVPDQQMIVDAVLALLEQDSEPPALFTPAQNLVSSFITQGAVIPGTLIMDTYLQNSPMETFAALNRLPEKNLALLIGNVDDHTLCSLIDDGFLEQCLSVGITAMVVGHHGCPPETLALYSKHFHVRVRAFVASNPYTPSGTLGELTVDTNVGVRRATARNRSTPPWALERLVKDAEDEHMLAAVAANPSTPAHLLTRLALSSDAEVRRAVAQNPNTPIRARTIAIISTS